MYVQHQVLISGGNNASVGTAPWNVGIYEKNDQSSYDMICGGTLISENLVVSGKTNSYLHLMKNKINLYV